ncbi:MAG: thioredoxin [Verrucomicrobiaceae bacterium]|nr:thioredoxin [Verrucomicrobiaceae bacterium]
MASDAVLTLTEANFESEIANSTVPVIVDFWAPWCGPCRMLTPILEDLAKEQDGKVKIGKVNVDEAPNLSAKFNVRSIPMLIFFKNGQAKETVVGVRSKDALLQSLAALG